MSLFTDLREMTGSAFEQLADRFPDLPAPVLAAIGAGDVVAERFSDLQDSVRTVDVAGSLQHLAATAPAQAQKLLTDLPARANQAAQSVSPESVRETVGGYARRAGGAFEDLARRGGESWARARLAGLLDVTPPAKIPVKAHVKAPAQAPATDAGADAAAAAMSDPVADVHPHLPVDVPAATTRKPRAPRSQTGAGQTKPTAKPTARPTPITAAPTGSPIPPVRRPAAAKSGTPTTGAGKTRSAKTGPATGTAGRSGTSGAGTRKPGPSGQA